MAEAPHPNQLTPQQETAIDLILAGKNDREVAQTIGKSRSTVNIWRNHDPRFIATLNDRRQQVWGGQLNRLNNLVTEAVDVLQDGLHDSDIKVRIVSAVHILKATGVYGAALPGSQVTDPAEVAADHEVKNDQRKMRLDQYKDEVTRSVQLETKYQSSAKQQSHAYAEERDHKVSSEISDTERYLKVEKDTENRTSLESTISTYSKIPQEALNKIDDDGLHNLISDFIGFRDDYLEAVEADLTNAYINSDPPPWEDYTEETDRQIEAELQRTKEKTDTMLQIFLNEWEKRGGDAAQLLKDVEERQIERKSEIRDRKQQLQEPNLPSDQKVPNLLEPLNNGRTLPAELENILSSINHKPPLAGNHNGAPGKI